MTDNIPVLTAQREILDAKIIQPGSEGADDRISVLSLEETAFIFSQTEELEQAIAVCRQVEGDPGDLDMVLSALEFMLRLSRVHNLTLKEIPQRTYDILRVERMTIAEQKRHKAKAAKKRNKAHKKAAAEFDEGVCEDYISSAESDSDKDNPPDRPLGNHPLLEQAYPRN
ncbi:uncharacterized protein LOC135839910 [Planococcus citri]|uniref:uncharacterized protein LOC135839910 n=1 Tax=Planococcus citri TaxID=170843 RepID=UPI0031F7F10C